MVHDARWTFRLEKEKKKWTEIPSNLLSKLNAAGQKRASIFLEEGGGGWFHPLEMERGERLPFRSISRGMENSVFVNRYTVFRTEEKGGGGGGGEEREEDLCRFVHERGHTYRLVNRVLNGLAGIDFR